MFSVNNHGQLKLWDPILNGPGVYLVSQILVVFLFLLTVRKYYVRVFMENG
jgi:hypothetical protein